MCSHSDVDWKVNIDSPAALFHLIWSKGPDLHDDVQTMAECPAGQGKPADPPSRSWLVHAMHLLFISIIQKKKKS